MAAAGVSLAAVHLGAGTSHAGEVQDFHEAVADAYGHYREAYFYVRRGNASVAAVELEPLFEKWRAVMDRPPATRPTPTPPIPNGAPPSKKSTNAPGTASPPPWPVTRRPRKAT